MPRCPPGIGNISAWTPRMATLIWSVMFAPDKISVAILGVHAEMFPIPGGHPLRIAHFEEDAADAGDSFHLIAWLRYESLMWLNSSSFSLRRQAHAYLKKSLVPALEM